MSNSVTAKQYEKEQQQLKDEIEKRTGKSTEQLYKEREKRAKDVVELKIPDRIPLTIEVKINKYAGILNSAAYYDPIGWKQAIRKITVDLEPDMCNAGLPTSGMALEALGVKNRLWPGGRFPPIMITSLSRANS